MPDAITDASGKRSAPPTEFGVLGELYGATFTIGTEASNAINVVIQLTDFTGADLATRASIYAYLSDDAEGDDLTGTVVTTETAIGTDGVLDIVTTKKSYMLTSESDGDIDIDITQTAAQNYYLVLVMPNGSLAVSGIIAHAG